MASAELRRLHQLYQVDQALHDIRKRAAALDPGRKTAAEIQALEKQADEAPARKLQVEQTDLELKQKSIDDKIKKYEKDLYGGKVVNPREVETIQKEIAMLKRQRGDLDGRILEIWEELPKSKDELDRIEKAISERKQALSREHKAVLQEKAALQAEFEQQSKKRPLLVKDISPALLSRYESIRQKHNGVGMSDVDVRRRTCGACGTSLPTRTIEALKEDKVITCESCHRILYYSEGAV